MPDLFEDLIPNEDTVFVDPNKKYLDELVGEGKRYATTEELSRAAMEKDAHIKRVERENAALRQTTAAQQKLEDLVTKLSKQAESPPIREQPPASPEQGENVLNAEQLKAQIFADLDQRDRLARQSQNAAFVKKTLQEVFGSNYAEHLRTVTSQLGLSTEKVNELAADSPAAFLKLVGAERQVRPDVLSPPQSAVATMPFTPKSGEKTRSYYRDMMKSDRRKFLSREVQNEMHEQAQRLGAAFHDV